MEKMQYFNYMTAAQQMQIPKGVLTKLRREIRREFPKDKMLYELHLLRAIHSGYWRAGKLRLD